MKSGIQHKLLSIELAPPPGVWDKIAAELDESVLSSKFPHTLYHAQSLPPVHCWQGIAAALDEPLFVQDYATKLAGIELAPPHSAWNKIKSSLEEENTVAPGSRRISIFIKYAAAAAILAFLAWGGSRLFSDNKDNSTVAKQETNNPENNSTAITTSTLSLQDENIGSNAVDASLEEARNDAALEASKKTFAKLDVTTTRHKIKNAADFFFVADDYDYIPTVGTRSLVLEPDNNPPYIDPMDMNNRYVILMTPDGNIIRMSKKLKELVCCVSGEDEDKACVDQMKKWRDKIANPATAHSPGNFLDIMSMINSLQDN